VRAARLFLVVVAIALMDGALAQSPEDELVSSLTRFRSRGGILDGTNARLVDELLAAKLPDKPNRLSFRVVPIRPVLNFALRYQTGYYFTLSLNQFDRQKDRILCILRVKPLDSDRLPIYWYRLLSLSRVPPAFKLIQSNGGFAVGEGKYGVELALVDTRRRWARQHWKFEVRPHGQKDIGVHLGRGEVQFVEQLRWKENATRPAGEHSRLTILLHAAPARLRSIRLQGFDQMMLLSSLSSIMEHRPFTHVRLIAFNLDQQRTLFQKEEFDFRGFQELARSLGEVNLGTVSYDVLSRREGHIDLLESLLRKEMTAEQRSDAVLVLGPTARQYSAWKREVCKEGAPDLFYFQYRPLWNAGSEFPDLIEHLMRACSGKTFRIHTPADLEVALAKLVRVVSP